MEKTGIPARIQPADVVLDVDHEQMVSAQQFMIYLDDDTVVDHNYRIYDVKDTTYKPIRSSGRRRVGQVQEVLAEITAWPLV